MGLIGSGFIADIHAHAIQKFVPDAEVIAVASVDKLNRRSSFSTYGDHILIAAPGEKIVSTGLKGYMVSSGTSHAAPFVAGVAALLVSRARRWIKNLSCGEGRRILPERAVAFKGVFSRETGYGFLNAVSALRHLERELNANRPP